MILYINTGLGAVKLGMDKPESNILYQWTGLGKLQKNKPGQAHILYRLKNVLIHISGLQLQSEIRPIIKRYWIKA